MLAALLAGMAALGGRASAAPPLLQGYLEAGPAHVDRSHYLAVTPGVSFENEWLRAGLAAPLRLLLNPSLAAERGVLRAEDWDGLSDAGRVLRRLELTLAERRLALRLGALAHQGIGHGTIVNGYGNSLDPDRLPVGAVGRVASGAFAVDLLVDDVLGPGVLGATLSIEPLSLGRAVDDRVHLTVSAFGDLDAPRGRPAPGAWIYGAGVDVAVWRSQALRLAPYFDANGRGSGFGLHAGLLADVEVHGGMLSAKAEWRRLRGPYAPEYFDIAYPIERWDALGGAGDPAPKADLDPAVTHGWRAELRARFAGVAASASVASAGEGRLDGAAVLGVDLDDWELAAFVAVRGMGLAEPARVFLAAEGRYRISPFFHAWASAGRLHRLERTDAGFAARPSLQLSTGLGAAIAP